MSVVSYVKGIKAQANFPNYLTALRALLPIPVVVLVVFEQHLMVVALIIVAAVTDWFDGYSARRWGMLTPLGSVADPLADKLFTILVLLSAVIIHGDVWLLVLWCVMVAYDIDNTWQRRQEIGRAILNLSRHHADLPATLVSKTKTAVLFGLMAYCYLPPTLVSLSVVGGLAVLALVLVLYSWFKNRVHTVKSWLDLD